MSTKMYKKIKNRLKDYLKKFGLPEDKILIPNENDIAKAPMDVRPLLERVIVVPYTLKSKKAGVSDLVLKAQIIFDEKWIQIKLLLMGTKDMSESLQKNLFQKLLIANFELNEVTYSLSRNQDVYVEADMPADSDYENFQSEYGSVVYGIDYFLGTVLKELSEIEAKSTFNPSEPNFFM
ncbi:MAG: hypothetical protein ACTSUE_00400 [Promethearchaeota archaeon]